MAQLTKRAGTTGAVCSVAAITRQQLATALAIQKALLNHPTAGKLLTHPSRAVEVSYFGIDEEPGGSGSRSVIRKSRKHPDLITTPPR